MRNWASNVMCFFNPEPTYRNWQTGNTTNYLVCRADLLAAQDDYESAYKKSQAVDCNRRITVKGLGLDFQKT